MHIGVYTSFTAQQIGRRTGTYRARNISVGHWLGFLVRYGHSVRVGCGAPADRRRDHLRDLRVRRAGGNWEMVGAATDCECLNDASPLYAGDVCT